MSRRRVVTVDEAREWQHQHAAGATLASIAARADRHPQTVSLWVRAELPPPPVPAESRNNDAGRRWRLMRERTERGAFCRCIAEYLAEHLPDPSAANRIM